MKHTEMASKQIEIEVPRRVLLLLQIWFGMMVLRCYVDVLQSVVLTNYETTYQKANEEDGGLGLLLVR